jgi:Cell wall-active antibiotics response 4TMS YvqF/Domain of unknown function (DUF5668)
MIPQQAPGGTSGFPITPQLIVGIFIIFIGVIFTLDELGIAPAMSYLRYWPTALIAIGIIKLIQARDGGGAFVGLMLTLAGAWLQAEELNLLHISLADVWPLGLVLLGGYLVWQGLRPRPPARPRRVPESDPFGPLPPLEDVSASSFTGFGGSTVGERDSTAESSADQPAAREKRNRGADRGAGCSGRRSAEPNVRVTDSHSTMSAVAILGAVTRGNNSRSFRGANLVAIMGGLEIDLRNAAIDGDAVIDVFAMWGGIEIRVPQDWIVSSQVVPLMGGVEDKTRPPQGATAHRLALRGAAFMGGIEIKN